MFSLSRWLWMYYCRLWWFFLHSNIILHETRLMRNDCSVWEILQMLEKQNLEHIVLWNLKFNFYDLFGGRGTGQVASQINDFCSFWPLCNLDCTFNNWVRLESFFFFHKHKFYLSFHTNSSPLFSLLQPFLLFFPVSMQMRLNWLGVKPPYDLHMSRHYLRKPWRWPGCLFSHIHLFSIVRLYSWGPSFIPLKI